MTEFILGASGSGKSALMTEKIIKAADNGRNVCIIVPEQFSYEFDKNLYKSVGAKRFNGIMSQSFTGLSRQLFQTYGDGRRNEKYADENIRLILVCRAIRNSLKNPRSFRCFERQAQHQGFAEEMLRLIGDLKRSGITAEMLEKGSLFLERRLMEKTRDTADIYLEFDRLMREYGFKDSLDDIRAAAEIAGMNGYFSGMDVFIDEFESFTGDQLEFIKVIAASADNVCISLRTDDVNSGEYTLFETVNATYNRLVQIFRELGKQFTVTECGKQYRFKHPDLAYLSANIMRNKTPDTEQAPKPDNITIFEARDFYGEADYVCAQIRNLVYTDRSLKYGDIAILSNKIEQYSDVLTAALARYEIPYFLSLEKPVMHNSLMIFITSLLDIAVSKKYRSEQLFRYIKCGMTGISLTDAAMLENYCYKWSVDGDVWNECFRADDINLDRLEELRRSVIEPLNSLKKKLRKKNTAEKMCGYIYAHIEECGAEKAVSRLMGSFIDRNQDYAASELKRIWSCFTGILDSTAETFGDEEMTASELAGVIRSLIARISYSVPPQTLDSVIVASARTARLNCPRIVFVMGANDGDFPNNVSTHGIFSETDKQKLSERGIDISRQLPELIASERLIVYKSFSIASDGLFISYSLSDLSGQSKYSSPVIDSIYKMFGTKSMLKTEADIPSEFYSVTMKSAFYRYMQDRKRGGKSIASIEKVLSESGEYMGRLKFVADRSQNKMNFRVSTKTVERLRNFDPFRTSPSSFETYNQCHFRYFCSECLRLFTREKVDLDARYSGSMIHNCFRRIMEPRSKEDFIRLGIDELRREISLASEEFLNSEMGGDYSKNPRFELAYRKLSERLLKVFVHTQNELRESNFIPKAFEINLRDGDDRHQLNLPFGNGKMLSFGGVIDRADICEIGDSRYVRIIDYKSSGKRIDPLHLSCGINMQMLLYLFAITGDGGLFSGYKPAGVLYSPVRINEVKSTETRIDGEDTVTVDSNLKASGLVLGDREVLEAMEHELKNRFIPVSTDKNDDIADKSSCISTEGLAELKNFTYEKLIRMAEDVHSGNADAEPLILNNYENPCNNCDFRNVCGDSGLTHSRGKSDIDVSEAEEILLKKKDV
ncbi:MAG: PD-(D/E)XK nuclease family protein [Ruminococcus sp.]